MSLWARLTKPSISKEEAEEKYYFTTSTGQIVSPEGSGYVIPALVPDVVEKQDYIPLDFAQQKVKDVTDEANRLREAYQKHLAELDSFYRQASTDSKAHYEGLIKDLKAKASRHVEIRKQMQAAAEEKLRGELKASEDSVEELRDSMASLNREYQEEVRSLKTTIGEGIKKTDDLTKEVTTLRDNADKVEAAVDLRHNTINETRAACRDTLLSICQTIEIQQMKEDIYHLENTNAEVAALQAEVLAVNEKNRQCHLQLKQAEQDRIEAAELQEQSAQYLIAVRNEHTEQLHALALAHRVKMLEARREYMTQLDRLYNRLHRSDVQNVVSEMCTTIAQQDANDALTQLNSNQQQNSLQYASQERALIQKFEQQLQTQREEFKTESDSLKKKFNHKMGQASARIRTAEVNVVLRDLVTQVVEQNTVAGSAAGAGAMMFGAAGQSDTTAVPTTEHQALLLKVQQLEEEIVQNQKYFEQQLQQQKQVSPRGGAAVVTTTGPTAAELAAQNELSEKLALLRSQEANLSEQLTTVSNKLAQYNTDLEKINHDKEECKNDIKEWSRAFLEANGREPNVQDKATVKDKYQRYKMLGAKAKEIEGKVGGYMGDEDEVSESLADIQAQISTLIGAVAVGAAAMAGAATTTAGAAVGAAAGAGAAGASAAGGVGGVGIVPVPVPLMVPQGPRAETVDASMQTEDRTAMLRKLNSQANLLTTASTKLQTPTKGLSDAAKAERRILELEITVEQDILTMEGLDDQIYTLNSTISTLQGEKNAIEQERALLTSQIDSLIHEKRTDVVLQYQTEIQGLHAAQSALNEKIAHLTAEKMKHEAKINELSSRTEAAEMELKARDAAELAQLSTAEEKALLKTQIAKQRDQITLKAKAATAGWDAAASSDERLDVEVEKAYKKGLQEERQAHIVEMHSLNGAIEIKENRITELLVSIAEMERKVLAADNKVVELNAQTEMLKLEVADTIQSLVSMSMGGGGGGGESQVDENGDVVIMPTPIELEQAREQLDTAQEELVVLMERVDRLQIDLDVARRKNRVYEQLVNVTGIGNAETAMQKARTKGSVGAGGFAGAAGGGGGGSKGTGDVNEIISIIKKAIAKGTNMWKSNRKDECYDVYNDACVECHDKLITTELKTPLNDAITTGKSMAIQNKQRAVVVVRKALDKLLADLEKPAVRKSEEDAGAFQRTQATELQEQHDTEHNEEVTELVSELNEIENNYLEQGYTKENNPSNTSQSPRGEPSADNNNNPSSLLARAKTAEAQVVTLKKQLAAVIAATANNNASGGASSKHNTGAAAAGLVAGAAVAGAGNRRGGANTGADPAEVRKLNRKIKELETQLKNNTGGGGGGGGGDNKALLQQEKALNKKIKDMETQYKRDSKATEMRATKAENALSKIEATYNSVVSERDRLRNENQKLAGLPAELAVLKSKTAYFEQVEANLETKNKEYDTLAEQFKKETTLRKKYKNELEDLKGAIRVYARCRPMAKYEIERGCKSVVELKDDTSLKLVTQRGEKEFEFDAVFGDNSTQDQVFEDTKRLVESCMDGFNVCLFAYGQTGSGKTFTMTGSPSMPGLTPKAIDELFRHIDERPHCNVRVTTYFVELYNDNLVDLYFVLDNKNKPGIAEPPKLDIKMDAKKMVYIRNAVIKEANSPSELMDLFNSGNLERHTGATKMNAESSRSHSIFAIMVDSYDTATKRSTTGKLSLVDLAGSERADKTGAAAERLKEAQNINKSLSALGDVIAALSEGTKFIPYRNNKLTQLMQDSLGGNAKTLMFVNFSPADYNSDETSTSLMYAARVKKIVNNASKAAESEEVAKLKAIIKRLQAGLPVEVQAAVEEEDEGPPPADDPNKVYDGY